jgi:hypothetical protein
MPTTYSPIASVTVGSGGATSVSFTSIPQIYTDLLVFISGRSDRPSQPNDQIFMSINNVTTAYTWRWLYSSAGGTGSQSAGVRYAGQTTSTTATASTFGNNSIYIPNYTGSNYKSYSVDAVNESNVTSLLYNMSLEGGLWSDTAAITSLVFAPEVGPNFVQYSSFHLYGILKS